MVYQLQLITFLVIVIVIGQMEHSVVIIDIFIICMYLKFLAELATSPQC